jgi:hypothetical protein
MRTVRVTVKAIHVGKSGLVMASMDTGEFILLAYGTRGPGFASGTK